jgi:hypothetical protein
MAEPDHFAPLDRPESERYFHMELSDMERIVKALLILFTTKK